MKLKRLSLLLLSLTLVFTAQPTFANTQPLTMNDFQKILTDVETNYYKPVSRDFLLQSSLKGMLESLDPYSVYFSDTEFQDFNNQMDGLFVGIGIGVDEHPQYITVSKVYPNSPALAAGVQMDDLITTINGEDVSKLDFNTRIDRLLGKEDTAVTIGILRGGVQLSKTITRKEIQFDPVEYKVLDGKIGYIRIYEFSSPSADQFEKALAALEKEKIKGLILDLRDNPGGYIDSVLQIAEHLVPKDTKLITVKYRTGQEVAKSQLEPTLHPLVVLINGNSASGSEMLAGIVKDNHVGTLIGTTTYGKGVQQEITSQNDGKSGGYKKTIAEFFTTSLTRIQGVGITPNIVLEQPKGYSEAALKNLAVITDPQPVKLGGAGLNVIAVEQRLSLLGYKLATDGVFDQQLADTLKAMGIDQDGILTQAEAGKVQNILDQASQKAKEDVQLKKAIEVISNQTK